MDDLTVCFSFIFRLGQQTSFINNNKKNNNVHCSRSVKMLLIHAHIDIYNQPGLVDLKRTNRDFL